MIKVKALSQRAPFPLGGEARNCAQATARKSAAPFLRFRNCHSGIPNCCQASYRILVRRVLGQQVGNTHRMTARGETTGCCDSASSCLRLAAAISLALSGLVSGSEEMRSSHSISAMVRSGSIRLHHPVRNEMRQTKHSRFAAACSPTSEAAEFLPLTIPE